MANSPPFATLNHFAGDLGIPRESATRRVGIRPEKLMSSDPNQPRNHGADGAARSSRNPGSRSSDCASLGDTASGLRRAPVGGVLFFLDKSRLQEDIDLAFDAAALVVGDVHRAGELDEIRVELLARFLVADGVLDLPEASVDKPQLRFQLGELPRRCLKLPGQSRQQLEL